MAEEENPEGKKPAAIKKAAITHVFKQSDSPETNGSQSTWYAGERPCCYNEIVSAEGAIALGKASE